jgi:hypothetical protein
MVLAYLDIGEIFVWVCLIGGALCWLIEIVAAFRNAKGPLLGILSILLSPVAGFMIGWVNNRNWRITQVMIMFTAFAILYFVAQLYRLYIEAAAV